MNLKECSLFSSPLHTGVINPSLYDKENIVNTLIKNFSIDPKRNNWGDSNMHMYAKDWGNPKFQKVDTSSLHPIYTDLFSNFLNYLQPENEIVFEYDIVNFNITNSLTGYMMPHTHLARKDCLFSVVHYLKAGDRSSILQFENPLIYNQYIDPEISKYLNSKFSSSNNTISSYNKFWNYYPQEDDVIIFPSYLKHSVIPYQQKIDNQNSDFRISTVMNLYLK
jgi:hypothetical protein